VPAVPALAGGGCHSGVTSGEGDTVELKDACFTPSILRVDPGAGVTFVNLDDLTHNVGGNLWGNFEDMHLGDAFTATFDEPGVYPFACSYHPGMTGAIVVGDGTGAGNGEEVTVASYRAPAAAPQAEVVPTDGRTADEGSSAVGWIATGAAGLVIGLGAGVFGRRRDGKSPAGS
jgi:plastocyanin